MKKIKSIIFALVMTLFMVTLVAGCGKKTKQQKDITVKSISASETSNASVNAGVRMAKLNAVLYDAPETTAENFNYFVIVKSKNNVTITITVDNPMDTQIDMVKVASSDEDAKIKTWNNQAEVWQNITDQPVVGWNGSSVYVTTYDLITKKDASEVTFTVTDFKVNGKWQESKELGNNVLHVFKYDDNDLTLNIKSNHLVQNGSEVKFEVVGKNGINVKNVMINSNTGTAVDGIYTATSETFNSYKKSPSENKVIVGISYTYQLNDKTESDILKTSFVINLATIENVFTYTEDLELYVDVNLIGDEVSNGKIEFYYEGIPNIPTNVEWEDYSGEIYKYKFTNPSWTSTSDIRADILKTTIKVDNKVFKVTGFEEQFLTLEYVTE